MVHHFLNTGDARSTSNMQKHVRPFWGPEVLAAADSAQDTDEVCTKIVKSVLCDRSITMAFKRKGKGTVTYSHQQHISKTPYLAQIVQLYR